MGDESPATLLHEAIDKERVKEVQRILKEGEVKLNHQNYRSGQPPPLIAATLKGSLKVMEAILEHPEVDLDYPDYDGKTALLHVCENYRGNFEEAQQLKMFKVLTDLGADINTMTKDGETPLHYAVKNQREELLKAILGQPLLDPNITDSYGRTPLYHASRERGAAAMFDLLLADERVDPNIQDTSGDTALLSAVKQGEQATIDVLLKCARLNVNIRDNENYGVLHHAIYNNNIGIVQTLLENKDLDLDVLDKDGMKDFWYAAQKGKAAVVKDFMRLKKPEPLDGQMAYLAASEANERGVMNMLKEYKDMSPEVAQKLFLPAVRAKHASVVSLVLKFVTDLDVILDDGNTYLTLALKNVSQGRDDAGRLIVHYIFWDGRADRTLCDKEGNSPYYYAFKTENQLIHEMFSRPELRRAEMERLAAKEGKKDIAGELAELLRNLINNH